jgi:hypothetical protein
MAYGDFSGGDFFVFLFTVQVFGSGGGGVVAILFVAFWFLRFRILRTLFLTLFYGRGNIPQDLKTRKRFQVFEWRINATEEL